ncbi:MAG: transporter substrate-binding domain-containing protein [Bacteroidaceae bacterium]|nr:transporter substrate-binding domain-containing protein [Bacteroidaceae bacterium]
MKQILPFALMCLVAAGLIGSCTGRHHTDDAPPLHDLPQIEDSGRLVALTLYSSTTYFIYRGEPMGFQYELAEQFARSLGVKLEIEVADNPQELQQMLLQGKGDIIACNLPITLEGRDSLLYCGEEAVTHQVLVQRGGRRHQPLTDVTQLIGKEVYVKPGRSLNRLRNLNKELGGGIVIREVATDSLTEEDLISQVALGKIAYTVCDNEVAKLNRTYYPQLNISLQVGLDQRSSWAVRKDQPLLAAAADQWHQRNATSPSYKASMKRYFEQAKAQPHYYILSVKDGKISHYDHLFKQYADSIGWDWRLLASLAYKESNFDTTVVSWAGARGLMQLMPRTARAMGVPEGMEHNAEASVKAATKYLRLMERSFRSIADPEERTNFVLASYNAGIGHIFDAMALAEKYGHDKHRWTDNVEKYVLLKSKPEYHNDPVCRNGYFRGQETYQFVREIRARYNIYKEKIKG